MATKSFLNSEQHEKALNLFRPWRLDKMNSGPCLGLEFSHWLSEKLLERFKQEASWQDCHPVLLGSWARGELTPKSDLDILFVGEEKTVGQFTAKLLSQGLKLRHRIPEDPEDWSKGVEAFDVLALLKAKALTAEGERRLKIQQSKIRARGKSFARELMQAMTRERKERNKRFDSISNYLEPNLKYGAGGLRDLHQALSVLELFPEKAKGTEHAQKVFAQLNQFFLAVRQRLHLIGGSDILTAQEQMELARWFEFEPEMDFMKEIQSGLSRVSFYADWVVERAKTSMSIVQRIDDLEFESIEESLQFLLKNPSILMQAKIRRHVDELFKEKKRNTDIEIGESLSRAFDLRLDENYLVALFHSRLLEKAIPDLARVKGIVQFDHYHRFTVETHLLQAMRELKRVHDKPTRYGKLAKVIKNLNKKDWEILSWATLYHDLAKGKGGDHSTKGAELARKDLSRFGLPENFIEEVAWLVENHLILSTAAFRRNPLLPSTWQFLLSRGAEKDRLLRLTVLTAIDIRATNPEAWTPWKERLLVDLIEASQSKGAIHFSQWLKLAQSKKVKVSEEFASELEPSLLEAVPPKYLFEDFQALQKTKGDLPLLILRNKKGEIWVRFHAREDRPGLFLRYVQQLFASSCQIQQSSIKTLPNFGVYDWFQVRTKKTPAQLKKLISLMQIPEQLSLPGVLFERMEVVSQDNQEVILSFRGKDQKGLLLTAASALFDLGFTIRWAKVHTWGRQIDDVFSVGTKDNIDTLLKQLEIRLVRSLAKTGL